MTTRIAIKFNERIEEVASWPWLKRLTYARCLDAVEPDQDELEIDGAVPDGIDSGDIPTSFGSTGRGITKGVSKHDNVLSVN